MSGLPLEHLFERFRTRGDLAALTQLFDEVAPELLPLALRLTGRRHDAEDLVQETFLVALEKRADFDAARPLRPWLVGILAHEARRLRRRSARTLEPDRVSLPLALDPQDHAVEAELRSAVDQAVGELPPKYSQLVSLHLFEGLAPGEMSARLGIDAALVRSQLARGLEKLRRSLPASTSAAWTGAELGLVVGALRTGVLARARSLPIQAGAAGTGVLAIAAGLAASLCVVAALTAGALSLVPAGGTGAAKLERVALEAGALPGESQADSTALEVAFPKTRESAAGMQPPAAAAPAHLHGRLLLPDGSPARGVSVTLEGRGNDQEVVQEPDAQTDAQGEFEFALVPPRAFQWFVRARHPGCVDLGWRLGEWIGDKELGSETFEPECVLMGTLARADGAPIGPGWTIHADPGQDGRSAESLGVRASGPVDPAKGTFRLEGLPAGSAHVEALHAVGLHGCDGEVLLAPGQPAALKLTWAGADPAHTVCAYLTDDWNAGVELQDLRAELVDRGGRRRSPAGSAPQTRALLFEDVPDSEWRLEVQCRNFRPVRQEGVKPGQLVRVHLEGNAGIRLHVCDAEGRSLEHYDARLSLKSGSSARARPLARIEELSADGRSFDAIPSQFPFELEIGAAGFGTTRVDGVALEPGETRALHILLAREREALVRVLGSDTKTPLAGVEVELTRGRIAGHSLGEGRHLYARGGEVPARDRVASTGPDGRVRFPGLAQDVWTARVDWSAWLSSETGIDLREGGTGECEFVLPEHGFLHGKVLLAKGARLADALLFVQADHAASPGIAFGTPFPASAVAADGSFRLGPLAPGRLTIFLMRCSEEEAGESRKPVEIARAEIEAGRDAAADIDLRRHCTAHLELEVLVDGKPMSNPYASVLLVDPPERGVSDSARGVSAGLLRIALAPEQRQRVVVRESGWVWALPEVLRPGECETLRRTVDVKLARGAILVLDEPTREPLRNVAVAWSVDVRELSDDPDRPGSCVMSTSASGTTDPEGWLQLALPPGELRFAVGDESGLALRFHPQRGAAGELEAPGVRLRWTDKGPAETTIALPRR